MLTNLQNYELTCPSGLVSLQKKQDIGFIRRG